jgi:tRNA-guanine family transglycosylase
MNELSAHRLLTIHNLTYVFDLVSGAREAIEKGTFNDYVASVNGQRSDGST